MRRPALSFALSLVLTCSGADGLLDLCANCWQNATVSVWLYEQLSIRIEGKIRVSTFDQATLLWAPFLTFTGI
jgi:hypothetical protein